MNEDLTYLLRILISIVLGFIIGYERKLRYKEAGVRTHAIVAAGSCLMMLVSKYGFKDIIGADGSRVAAQIVSGIGFIGAGMILYKRQALHGLTTAAGIWTTAGIGMAVGSGMYILSVGTTILIVLVQCIMHLPCKLFISKTIKSMRITFLCNNNENEIVKKIFEIERFNKINANREGENIVYTTLISTEKFFSDNYINKVLKENSFISSIERVDEE
jgi:putative Mg2+ transporter-C (MgtC) family protein